MIFAVILILLSIVTIVGNSFCLLVIRHDVDGISDVVRIFMKSLTAADLFNGILTTVPSIGPAFTNNWPYSHLYCRVFSFTQNMLGTCSTMSLFMINIDRYIAIVYPLHYPRLVTVKRARGSVITLWIFSIGWASLHVFRPGQIAVYNEGIYMCVSDPDDVNSPDITSALWAMCFFGLPCVVSVLMFLRLFCISRRHAQRIDDAAAHSVVEHMANNNRFQMFRRAQFKTSVTFFILTISLIVTWIPVSVIIALESSKSISPGTIFGHLAGFLFLVNSCVNVFVYFIRNHSFRERSKQLLGIGRAGEGVTMTSNITVRGRGNDK